MRKTYLVTLRQSQGLTQEQLARELGVSAATLCLLENGQRMPTPAQKEALETRFGVNVDELLQPLDGAPRERKRSRTASRC